jgi:Tfp pilus assembly protein PilV
MGFLIGLLFFVLGVAGVALILWMTSDFWSDALKRLGVLESAAAKLVEDMENNPEDWVFGQYTFTNKKLDVQIWVANGMSFLDSHEGHGPPFSLTDKFLLWSRIKRAQNLYWKKKIEGDLS